MTDASQPARGRSDARPERDADAGLRAYFRAAWTVARKDFVLEIRSKQAVPLSVTLSLLVVVVFAFTFPAAREGSGALWTAFLFAGMLGVNQSVAVEAQNRALDAVLLAPISPSALYVGKVVSNTLFVSLVGVTTLGAVSVFLQPPVTMAEVPTAVAVVVLFSLGFAAVSVVVALITTLTSISALLLPVLLVPLLIPVLLAAVAQLETGRALWFTVLLGYDGIVFVAGTLVFQELVW